MISNTKLDFTGLDEVSDTRRRKVGGREKKSRK